MIEEFAVRTSCERPRLWTTRDPERSMEVLLEDYRANRTLCSINSASEDDGANELEGVR